MPIVSVIIPAYNHDKFIRECIQSVLDQTYQDFEIVITDDFSTDHTVDVIENFTDPRISLYRHSKNKGVSEAANNCLRHASGKYIAWLSSDDAWYPDKLAMQVNYLDDHPEIAAVFGKVEWIDRDGNTIKDFQYINVFNVENRTRYEWLQRFFVAGNCLSLPSSLVRKECFAETGMFDPAFAKIQDFDLWVRICLKNDIMILDHKLIRNRWISDEMNESGDTIKNRIQVGFEWRHTFNHYLKISRPDELKLIFPDIVQYGEVTTETIPYFLARNAIASRLDIKMLWGLDILYQMLQNDKIASILEDKYEFSYKDFIKLVRENDPFGLAQKQLFIEQLQTLTQQIADKDRLTNVRTDQISDTDVSVQFSMKQVILKERTIQDSQNSLAFRINRKVHQIINISFPKGTRRRYLLDRVIHAIK